MKREKVKLRESKKEVMPIHVSPLTLLKIWLSGEDDFSFVSTAVSKLSQEKSGSLVTVNNIEFQRTGFSAKVVHFEENINVGRVANLMVSLTKILSNKSALDISTIDAAA